MIAYCTYSALYQSAGHRYESTYLESFVRPTGALTTKGPLDLTTCGTAIYHRTIIRTSWQMTTQGSRHVHIGCPAHGTFGLNLESSSGKLVPDG